MWLEPIIYDIVDSLEEVGVMTKEQRDNFLKVIQRRAEERFTRMVEARRNAPDTRTRMEKIMGVRR